MESGGAQCFRLGVSHVAERVHRIPCAIFAITIGRVARDRRACALSLPSCSLPRHDLKPPFSGLCQLRPAADITPNLASSAPPHYFRAATPTCEIVSSCEPVPPEKPIAPIRLPP